jgi:hypothetical protein
MDAPETPSSLNESATLPPFASTYLRQAASWSSADFGFCRSLLNLAYIAARIFRVPRRGEMLRPGCYGVKLVTETLPRLLFKVFAVERARKDAAQRVSELLKWIGHLAGVADSGLVEQRDVRVAATRQQGDDHAEHQAGARSRDQ